MGAFEDQIAADVANTFALNESEELVIYTSRSSGVSKEVPAIVERGETAPEGGYHKTNGDIWLSEGALAPEITEINHHDSVEAKATGEQWLIHSVVSRELGMIKAEIEQNIRSTFRE